MTPAPITGRLAVVGLLIAIAAPRAYADADNPRPVEAARGVLRRVIPTHADRFTLAVIPTDHGRDVFEVEAADGRVTVRGSSGVALASGAYWYLQNACHADVSWCGDQVRLPDPLPSLTPVRKSIQV